LNEVTSPALRKLCVNLSVSLRAGVDYLLSLPIDELIELAKEVMELAKRKRV
jgi:hypothetical protein